MSCSFIISSANISAAHIISDPYPNQITEITSHKSGIHVIIQIRMGIYIKFFLLLHDNEVLPMSTHNICFRGEVRKISVFFWLKKKKSILSGTMSSALSYVTVGFVCMHNGADRLSME